MSSGTTVVDCFRLRTPIGDLEGFARSGALCALDFAGRGYSGRALLERRFGSLELRSGPRDLEARRRLEAYLAGELDAIDAIEVDTGGTPFQEKVWAALRRIPAGRTISYTELARQAGLPHAVRAAGTANGSNPVPIVIPCHRVVRSDGTLGGYGGGLDRKRWLLDHERARLRLERPDGAQRPLFAR
jgi:methylated-DNA-[protein]-cysteine S-methyltransferase